jgi:probable DNA repair protein
VETPGASNRRSTIVVANALAASQWEMHLAAEQIRGSAFAWETPPVRPYAAWIEALWLDHADERGPALTPNQSSALWQRVVADSADGSELIGQAGAAEWAAGAWQLLHRFRLDPDAQRAAASEIDYRAFLGWCRRYREILNANGWIDRAELESALSERVTGTETIVVADSSETYPARLDLFERLSARGRTIEQAAVPEFATEPRTARLADAADELRAAFAWAKRRLAAQPLARLALVLPMATRRYDEIERAAAAELGEHNGQLCSSEGKTVGAEPAVGAAVDALRLAGADAAYATFGRWLRSPFFALPREEQFARARIDTELRAELRSQLPFQAAYRCGLRELLAERAPESARALAAALATLGGVRRATPNRWTDLWARYLGALGWLPPTARAAQHGWQTSLEELGRLTPIVGEISLDVALTELARILERTQAATPPVRGVHVLGHIDDVGPGYAGVWVAGFTDSAWPEPPHGNPLLPLRLQRDHAMPYCSPRDAQERSDRALERLVRRSRELIVSWPARLYDYETQPSPAIRLWPALSAGEIDAPPAARAPRPAPRETVVDAAPPFAGTHVAGGTAMLGRQARCPLRAFCQDRLGAKALEPLGFGVSARLRGTATHRAAERLLEDLPTQVQLAAKASDVPASVEGALDRLFGRAGRYLAALYELEAEQLQRVLAALLADEQRRAPFRVRAVEQRATVALGPLTLNIRIDRVDELADGTIAIIDYKTGERATSADWFGARLRDAQVPLYAIQSADVVGAAVVTRLVPPETRYSGLWTNAAFPGRPNKSAHPETGAQIGIWRGQLELLAAEFAAGDTRFFVADFEDAGDAYAPLTRVFEQLGLARGAVPRW